LYIDKIIITQKLVNDSDKLLLIGNRSDDGKYNATPAAASSVKKGGK